MKKLVLIVSLLLGVNAYAGDSGCGLGSVIIQKNSKGLQLLSMTTNSIFFTQPLGITSGTSGCSSRGLVMADKEVQYFVEVNHEDLSREMAQGQGEKLAALAQMKGCQSHEAQQAFAHFAQSSYSKIYTSAETTSSQMIHNLNNEMKAQGGLASMCHGS